MDRRKGTLLTHNDLELECLILDVKPLISGGAEVLVYAQNRLVKGFIQDIEDDLVAETSVFVSFCIIPELSEELYEIPRDY